MLLPLMPRLWRPSRIFASVLRMSKMLQNSWEWTNVQNVINTQKSCSGANDTLQTETGSCGGMIPEGVMNIQVNVYPVNKQTGISRMDPNGLTQPLKIKDPFSMHMIFWNMIFLYWIHHLRLSRYSRVPVKLSTDTFNSLKINQKNAGPHGGTRNFFYSAHQKSCW